MSDTSPSAAAVTASLPPSPWLTVQGAAQYASVSTDLIYVACERDELRHVRIGGRRAIRVRAEWIDMWLERHARGRLS